MEGVYTHLCKNCPTLFGVVSRFSGMEDRVDTLVFQESSSMHWRMEEIITNETNDISQRRKVEGIYEIHGSGLQL
ncbi:hypothetical protein ACV242_001923 [Peribacillus simplex]